MESNDYNEVIQICRALDTMIDHMDIIIKELPDVLLMTQTLIPNRMKEVMATYEDMTKKGYVLDYLNIEYNIEESKKNIETILDKVKVINLEGCMFDLKTMLEYYDSLFIDFEKERLSRKVYEEVKVDFTNRLEKTNQLVSDVYSSDTQTYGANGLKAYTVNTSEYGNYWLTSRQYYYQNSSHHEFLIRYIDFDGSIYSDIMVYYGSGFTGLSNVSIRPIITIIRRWKWIF